MEESNNNLHNNNVVKDTGSNIALEFSQDRITQYSKAVKNKHFVLGQESHRNGVKADYSHLDFLFSIVKFPSEGTRLQDLTILWGVLWEYLGPVLKSYENLSQAFLALERDQGEVLQEYGENSLELKIYKKYMKHEVSNETIRDFHKYLKAQKLKNEQIINKIQAEEKAKNV